MPVPENELAEVGWCVDDQTIGAGLGRFGIVFAERSKAGNREVIGQAGALLLGVGVAVEAELGFVEQRRAKV
jgi:hypothetical protein